MDREAQSMNRRRSLWGDLAVQFAAFVYMAVCVSLLWRNNLLLLGAMSAECVVVLALWHDRLDLSFFLVIGVLGTLAEALFVYSGVWRYANPSVLGVPVWFPVAFGTTGLIGGRMARTLAALWGEVRRSST
ncbi:MAG: hypothetical protein K6V36_05055 [Anaerolineae bacterium]|nr:hypothetical protein [Anaerolineae bacterium]